MPSISKYVPHSTVIRYKAPANKQFLVKSVFFVNSTIGNGIAAVVGKNLEDNQYIDDITMDSDSIIALNVTHDDFIVNREYYLNHPTKYLSLSAADNGTFIIIEYELIGISKIDLLWEWLGFGR